MGWYYERKRPDQSVKDWFAESLSDKVELLDLSVVRMRTMYGAIKNKESGQVYAIVYLLDMVPHGDCNIGYKPMDETMGPNESECPERILKLLTPTDSQFAKEWRERCWANINRRKTKPKVKDGSRIKFDEPLTFTNGAVLDEFTVHMIGKKIRFISGGGLYRITNWRDREFQIVG